MRHDSNDFVAEDVHRNPTEARARARVRSAASAGTPTAAEFWSGFGETGGNP